MSFRAGVLAIALLLSARSAVAQETDSLVITASAPLLSVHTVTAGAEPAPVLDSASTYSVTTSTSGQKIVARLEFPLPPGTALDVQLEAPAGAVSHGFVTLTTLDQALVTNLPAGSATGLRITYRFTTTLAAGDMAATGRSLRFTLTPGP